MNNLKRILSLALASVMLVGMMVVGASAAEFTDAADIENSDAVNSLVALKVISGYDDGSFRPTGDVTRAQMAKMIAVALNGGNEDFRGSSSGSKFVDVKDGMWYTKFVNYCASKNIINGVDATHFNPESNVTAQEAAVMIMRAMGFRNESFLDDAGKFSWGAVNDWAESIGLYDDTSVMDLSKPADRQNAAQIIYNGIQQPTAKYTMTYNSEGIRTWALETKNGKLTGAPILESAYNAKVQYAILTNSAYNTTDKTFTYTFAACGDDVIAGDKLTNNGTDLAATEADYSDLYMQKVRVVYAGKDILGISAVGNCILASGVGTPYDKSGKLDGVTKDANVTSSNFNGMAGTNQDWWAYDLIDNNSNSKVDHVVYHPVTVGKVNVANATQVSFTNGVAAVALKGNNVEEGLKRDDLVTITVAATGVKTVKKLDVVENVTATFKDQYDVYTIGGEEYEMATWNPAPTVTLGKTYNLSVLNGYVFAAVDTSTGTATAGLNNLVFASEAGPVKAGTNEVGGASTEMTQLVRFMYANGTETAVKTVVSLGQTTSNNVTTPTPLKQATTDTCTDGKNNGSCNHVVEGTFYTYTENKDGTYALMPVDVTTGNTDFANMTCKTPSSKDIEKGVMDGIRFNDEAVVFVKNTYTPAGGSATTQYKMFTGKEINEWEKLTGKSAILWTSKVSGFDYTVVGTIDLGSNGKDEWPGAAANGDHFGYLVAAADRAYVAELKGEYTRLTIWTGTETVIRYVKENGLTTRPAGTIVRYKEASDDTITLVTTPSWTAKPVAVTAYAGGNTIQFAGATNSNDWDLEKATIIYVDAAKKAKADTGAITLANSVDPTDLSYGYYNNAYLVEGANNAVLALIVDVNNGLGSTSVSVGNGVCKKVLLDNVLGATANFPAEAGTIKVAPSVHLTDEKVMEGTTELFNVANELAGATYSNEAAIVKVVIPGMKAGDKISVNGSEKALDADATYYLIVGNQTSTTKANNNKGLISVTITYTPVNNGTDGTPVNYTLTYDAWGTAK